MTKSIRFQKLHKFVQEIAFVYKIPKKWSIYFLFIHVSITIRPENLPKAETCMHRKEFDRPMTFPYFPMNESNSLSPDEATQFLFEMASCVNRYLAEHTDVPAAHTGSPVARIHAVLLRIGVPPHVCGFRYLTEAIHLALLDSSCLERVTLNLYPKVAEAFQVPRSSVERGIRHAIALAWSRQKPGAVESLFGRCVVSAYDKPTSNELIATIVDYFSRKTN